MSLEFRWITSPDSHFTYLHQHRRWVCDSESGLSSEPRCLSDGLVATFGVFGALCLVGCGLWVVGCGLWFVPCFWFLVSVVDGRTGRDG